MLKTLQADTFQYFVQETNPANGLVADSTATGAPASITAVGLGLAAYVVAVERGLVSRETATERVLTTLRFFWSSPQGPEPDATGYKGFFYHFLDIDTGRRVMDSELSTIDTAFFIAGALAAAAYFTRDTSAESEVRDLAQKLYRRIDWQWAQDGQPAVSHGWRPEDGFILCQWEGYNEALLLYALGLGSPTYPLPPESYRAWSSTHEWREVYGQEYVHAGPLFIHQLSHVWIDFRDIQDAYMRGKGSDYFENSRRATLVQQAYAIDNPRDFSDYDAYTWGITASAGPGKHIRVIDGIERQFFGYKARGVPDGPDDGTLSPWAVIASLPFTPQLVLETLHHYDAEYPEVKHEYGFRCSFNPTFPDYASETGRWVSAGYYGLNQGPIMLMIENFLTGLLWRLMAQCPYLVRGLRRAGFRGGWLAEADVEI
jgi:hypothetical protein